MHWNTQGLETIIQKKRLSTSVCDCFPLIAGCHTAPLNIKLLVSGSLAQLRTLLIMAGSGDNPPRTHESRMGHLSHLEMFLYVLAVCWPFFLHYTCLKIFACRFRNAMASRCPWHFKVPVQSGVAIYCWVRLAKDRWHQWSTPGSCADLACQLRGLPLWTQRHPLWRQWHLLCEEALNLHGWWPMGSLHRSVWCLGGWRCGHSFPACGWWPSAVKGSCCCGSKQSASRIKFEFRSLLWYPDSVVQLVGKKQAPTLSSSAHGQSPRICVIEQIANCRRLWWIIVLRLQLSLVTRIDLKIFCCTASSASKCQYTQCTQ